MLLKCLSRLVSSAAIILDLLTTNYVTMSHAGLISVQNLTHIALSKNRQRTELVTARTPVDIWLTLMWHTPV